MKGLEEALLDLKLGKVIAYPSEGVWALGCDPKNEIAVNKLLSLKKRLLEKGAFKDENEIDDHIKYIETENNKLDKVSRMRELENWLDYLNLE